MRVQPLTVLKAPLWLAALATGAKSFVANPIIGNRRLNGWGLHSGRLRLAASMARFRRGCMAPMVSAQDRESFAQDGFIVKQNVLSEPDWEQLRREVFDADWEVREMRQGATITRRVPLDAAALRGRQPMLAALVGDRAIANCVRYVSSSGGQPIFWLQAILAGQETTAHDPQTDLHSDTFQSTAKAWLFLHDVGPEEGPFAYVRGSHRLTASRLAWEREQSMEAAGNPIPYHARGSFRVSAKDLARMGLPEPTRFSVKANTLIVADTFGFHARTPSSHPTCRVEFYASLRRTPFLPWPGLDPRSLPYLRERTASGHIRLLEFGRRLGLAKMPWKPVGRMRINASVTDNPS